MEVILIPDIKTGLKWLEKHTTVLKDIGRGIERETLRIDQEGHLVQTSFPKTIGSALTHSWVTTDFAEAMLEFITPVSSDLNYTMTFLRDLHRYAMTQIDEELMWPLSMPCFVAKEEDIILAQYGDSNEGKLKTIYRRGLKNRYGAMMQTISGVHYNFSFPLKFWQAKYDITKTEFHQNQISDDYFHLIRNYHRFGWLIPYLFGASPSICTCFIKDPKKQQDFLELTHNKSYLPYATSLRLSDLGYTNDVQSSLNITFNNLQAYVKGLQHATQKRSEKFAKIGVNIDGNYQQINDNVLQIENEFYAPIRPKRVMTEGETPLTALLNQGVEYIEVRSLDVNPFTPIGVTADQIRFIDLFLIWCILAESPKMDKKELNCTKQNWNRIILEGRKPNQIITFGEDSCRPLADVGREIFNDLFAIAEILDKSTKSHGYTRVCKTLVTCFDDPELTLSGRTLQAIKDLGTAEFGLALAKQYQQQLLSEPLQVITETDFIKEREISLMKQQEKERSDVVNFDEFIQSFQKRKAKNKKGDSN